MTRATRAMTMTTRAVTVTMTTMVGTLRMAARKVGSMAVAMTTTRPAPRASVARIATLVVTVALPGPTGSVAAQTAGGRLAARPANLEVVGRPLIEALRALQTQSGVPLGFSADVLPADRTTECLCRDVTVGVALSRLLEGTSLTFVERRSQILLVPDSLGAALPSLVGVVRESGSRTPIRSARVEIHELGRATLTDASGRFEIPDVPPGSYRVATDALGFRTTSASEVRLEGGRATELDVDLDPSPLALAEMVVAPGTFGILGDAALLPQTLTREQMETLPQIGEDVFRALERVPGLATDDISAKFSVRGGNDDELLVMLDGTELVEPYHLKDLDAVLGVVDMGALRGASLAAGGMPTEYGDRMAGLLDMRSRQPIGSGARHSIGLSASNVTLRTQGALGGGRGGWFVSARRGFLDLLLKMADASGPGGDNNDDLSPSYFDVMAKFEFLPTPAHRLSAHVLYAGDDLDLAALEPPDEEAALGSKWTNWNAWTGWDWTVSPSLEASTVLTASGLTRRRTGDWVSPGSSEVADFAVVDDRADFGFATLRQDWQLGIAGGTVIKFGGQLRHASSDYRYSNQIGQEFVQPDGSIGVARDTTLVFLEPTSWESSVYVATRVRPFERLTLEAGLRYDRMSHTADSDLSPRLSGALDIGPSTTLRGSVGAYRQSHGVEELSAMDGDTIFYPSELARQLALGLQHRFAGGLEVRLEGYLRRTADPRPRYANVGREIIPFPEIGNDRVRISPDEARARGVELSLSGPAGGRADWSASYVLASAEDRVDGRWTPRTLDQRHTVAARWHFEPNEKWTFTAGWQYHTGWPATPMTFQVDTISGADPEQRQILITERPGEINSTRLPAYHRLDARVTRSFHVGSGRLNVFLDVFNVYNRANLRSYEYSVALPSGMVVTRPGENLLPLLPSFGFTWEF